MESIAHRSPAGWRGRSRSRRNAAVFAIAAFLTSAPVGGWAIRADPGAVAGVAAVSCGSERDTALQSEMRVAHDRIVQSPAYTGIALNGSCGPVDVYSTGSDPRLRALTVASLPAQDFAFHVVANSLTTLFAVQDRVTADEPALRSAGLRIFRYWPEMSTGKETIQVVDGTATQLAMLTARYGAALVAPVSISNPPVFTTHRDASNDVPPPFNGADFIAQVNAQQIALDLCTSAYGVHTGSGLTATHYILTAGHCNEDGNGKPNTGAVWDNALVTNSNFNTAGSLAPIGAVTSNFLGQNVDGAYISVGAGTTNDWQGWYTSGYLNSQRDAGTALVGNNVCVDGAYDGLQCGGIVQSTGYLGCINFQGDPNTFCHTVQDQTSGSVISGEGDSGAPVMLIGPFQVSLGIESGGQSNLACPHFQWRGNVCGAYDIFTDLPSVLSKMNAAVNTFNNP